MIELLPAASLPLMYILIKVKVIFLFPQVQFFPWKMSFLVLLTACMQNLIIAGCSVEA